MTSQDEFAFISRGTKLFGLFVKGRKRGKAPVVMILTGDSPRGLNSPTWPPLIERLASRGLSVAAFDFLSQGGSSGERSALSLAVGSENATDFAKEIGRKSGVEISAFSYVGSSFGGAVLLNSLSALPEPSAIVFKSPAIHLAEAYRNDLGEEETIDQWRERGVSAKLGLPFRAYEEAEKANLAEIAIQISCAALIIHGTDDEIVPIERSRQIVKQNRRIKLREIRGAKHDYKQSGAGDKFLRLTSEFLARHMRG